jgi:hypothetical protein
MRKKAGDRSALAATSTGYDAVLSDLVGLLEQARRASARAVNFVMASTYWQIGRRIVEQEQHGRERAVYGQTDAAQAPVGGPHNPLRPRVLEAESGADAVVLSRLADPGHAVG